MDESGEAINVTDHAETVVSHILQLILSSQYSRRRYSRKRNGSVVGEKSVCHSPARIGPNLSFHEHIG
jgi:hypothetical protein